MTHDKDFWQFVHDNLTVDASSIMLRYGNKNLPFNIQEAVTQIDCRRRTAHKLPSFNRCREMYYPSRLAAEQASNETVATFHASLVPEGSKVADLTAGLGIDAMTIASRASSVTVFEIDKSKNEALLNNTAALGIGNVIVTEPCDSIERIRMSDEKYDVIFIDPARRDDANHRTYALDDCTPDVKKYLDLIKSRCRILIIKASPMLDMTQTERDFPGLKRLIAVSWHGECKEILAVVDTDYIGAAEWSAVMINSDGNVYEYVPEGSSSHEEIQMPSSLEGCYLYEPDAAVLKLGAKAQLTACFPMLIKCDTNTNVYISQQLIQEFPGRVLKISRASSLGDKSLKTLRGAKANVVCRNFPMSPDELKKRLKVKDGGKDFVYGLRIGGEIRILLATATV